MKLPLVLMAISSTPHRSTGVIPFEMMTGREITLLLYLFYCPEDVSKTTAYTAHQYVTDLRDHLQATFLGPEEHGSQCQRSQRNRKMSHRKYHVRDKVLYFRFANLVAQSRKFLPSWSDPFEVVGKLSLVAD